MSAGDNANCYSGRLSTDNLQGHTPWIFFWVPCDPRLTAWFKGNTHWPWAWPCWNCITSYKFSVSVKKMGEGWTGGASDIVKAKSSGKDPRATGGLVSNLPHPRVNKTKKHIIDSLVVRYFWTAPVSKHVCSRRHTCFDPSSRCTFAAMSNHLACCLSKTFPFSMPLNAIVVSTYWFFVTLCPRFWALCSESILGVSPANSPATQGCTFVLCLYVVKKICSFRTFIYRIGLQRHTVATWMMIMSQ